MTLDALALQVIHPFGLAIDHRCTQLCPFHILVAIPAS